MVRAEASLWCGEESTGGEETTAGDDAIALACRREARTWFEVWMGLGSMGILLVNRKDTQLLYSKEDPVACVEQVGEKGLTGGGGAGGWECMGSRTGLFCP